MITKNKNKRLKKQPDTINIIYTALYFVCTIIDVFLVRAILLYDFHFITKPYYILPFVLLMLSPFYYKKLRKRYIDDGRATDKHLKVLFILFIVISYLLIEIPLVIDAAFLVDLM